MQITILIITLVLMSAVALFFMRAVSATKADHNPGNVERWRSIFIWVLIIAGVVITGASLKEYPHAIATGSNVVQINATAGQWYWEIDKQEVPQDSLVVFNLSAKDVNHGFGILSPSGELLLQTQAMPGYVNKVQYVFDKPGNYKVICLEFCGIGHHDMIDEFTVIAKK